MADTITPSRVAVFMALAKDRSEYKTTESLAGQLSMSARTCARHLKDLVECGVVETAGNTVPAAYRVNANPTGEAADYARRLVLGGEEFGL